MKLVIADGFLSRLLGWAGRRRIPDDQALWLVPCRAVHTVGMRVALDLVFLDHTGRILRIDSRVAPCRARWHRCAHSVLEMGAGAARGLGLVPGTRVRRGPSGRLMTACALAGWVMLLGTTITLTAPAWAGAPLLEEPEPTLPPTIPFSTEWPAEPERWMQESSVPALGGAAIAESATLSQRAPRVESDGGGRTLSGRWQLPALTLTRPLAAATLERLMDEAESLYQGRQWQQALEAFQELLEWDPRRRQAWLRVGNLHHQRQQIAQAVMAYQRAAGPGIAGEPELGAQDASARAKALANLISLDIERIRESMNQWTHLGGSGTAAMSDVRQEAREILERLGTSSGVAPTDSPTPPRGAMRSRGAESPPWAPVVPRVSVEYLRDPPAAGRVSDTVRGVSGR